jgi:hypothetical protein
MVYNLTKDIYVYNVYTINCANLESQLFDF